MRHVQQTDGDRCGQTGTDGDRQGQTGTRTFVSLPANTGQPEGLRLMVTRAGKKTPAALNVRAEAGLTGLPGSGVAIVTLLTPKAAAASVRQAVGQSGNGGCERPPVAVGAGGVLPAAQAPSCGGVTLLRQPVALAGAAEGETPEAGPAVVAAPARDLQPTRTLTSDLVA